VKKEQKKEQNKELTQDSPLREHKNMKNEELLRSITLQQCKQAKNHSSSSSSPLPQWLPLPFPDVLMPQAARGLFACTVHGQTKLPARAHPNQQSASPLLEGTRPGTRASQLISTANKSLVSSHTKLYMATCFEQVT
jgi:hypothetical protein